MSIRDEMVRCPFDENHRVSRARFPVHLIKCRKQHKNKNFSICPFNATHYVLTPEFQFHLDNCPDRKERDLAAALSDEDQPSSHVKDIVVPPPSEIWGNDEEEVVSYLDVKDQLIEKLPILRTPSGMTKSERKRFVRREIHRFHNLAREQQASTSRGPINESDWEYEERRGREEGKLEKLEEEQEEDQSDNDQAAGKGASGKKAAGKEASGKKAAGKEASGKKGAGKEAAGKKAAVKEAQGYEAEDDEDRGAVGGKQESDGQFSVVKRKKKKKKSSSHKKEVEEKGGKSSSDKNKSHRRKHH